MRWTSFNQMSGCQFIYMLFGCENVIMINILWHKCKTSMVTHHLDVCVIFIKQKPVFVFIKQKPVFVFKICI